jgi:glycosyltransferase involved in cell wall biosynthesis
MKIVLLNERIPPEGRGGAERVTWSLAQGLQQAGHEVHVIVTTPHASFSERREGIMTYHLHGGYPLRWQAWLSLYNPQTIPTLRQLLKTIQPDIVHAHNIHLNLSYASLTVAHRLGFPTVFTAHDLMAVTYGKLTHWINPAECGVPDQSQYRLPRFYNLRQMRLRYNPFRNLLIRQVLNRNAVIRTCISAAQQQALIANHIPPFIVVPNGINPSSMTVSTDQVETLRTRLDLSGHRVILFAARMSKAKGGAQMLLALEKLLLNLPDILLLVLSDKLIEWESPEQAARLKDQVRSAGWLNGSELNAAYQISTVIAVPSIYLETSSMVALEAMAARKPVIATCYGGPPEIVIDGETGYVVNPFDTNQFADGLRKVLNDPTLARQMGEAGHRRVEETFPLSKQVARFVQIYQDAIALNRHR